MKIQKFRLEDYTEYKSWYENQTIREHLGTPPDKEWLAYILKGKDGAEYSFFEKGTLVAVIGIVFPDKEHPHLYITDIAVNPKIQRQGIGEKVLNKLVETHPIKIGQSYMAFVDIKNNTAQAFFKKLGWLCANSVPDNDNMLTFTFKTKR